MAKPELLGEVKKLISMGKEKGFLTYDELNSTLPAEVVSSEQFGSIMTMFGEMDIEIVDAPEGERIRKARDTEEASEEAEEAEVEAGASAGEESEKEEKEEKEIDLTPGALSRTDDPVRLYLKEMGSVALLSREGEIEIAKRIEEGKKDIASVIYGMPMTIEFVLALCDQLKNGTIDVREIVPIVETEEEFEEEQIQRDYEELRVKTLEGLNSVRKISTSLKSLYEVVRHANSDPAKQKKIKKQIDTIRDQVVEKMESVNLHGVLKDRMVQRVRELAIQIRTAEREIVSCMRRLGISGEAGAEALKKLCRERKDFLAVKRKSSCSEEALTEIKKIYQAARSRVRQLETEEALVVVAPLPGVMGDDVIVTVERGRLTIEAAMRTAAPKHYLLHEWHYGPYERTIDLPHDCSERLETSFGNGLGPNALRMAAQILVGQTIGGVTLHGNAGLALHDEVFRTHEQRDFLAYGLAAVVSLRPGLAGQSGSMQSAGFRQSRLSA